MFWTQFSGDLEPKMVPNASVTGASFQTKIETNATWFPCWCFFVLEGASGRDVQRFWIGFWDEFRSVVGALLWQMLGRTNCGQSSRPSAAKLFGVDLWHIRGIKFAITRSTHPQHSFSKGGGLAKRPQLIQTPDQAPHGGITW